jgi:hypothetical protein
MMLMEKLKGNQGIRSAVESASDLGTDAKILGKATPASKVDNPVNAENIAAAKKYLIRSGVGDDVIDRLEKQLM